MIAKQTVNKYGQGNSGIQAIGDGVQFPLIILGASQFELGRPTLGWVLIGAGIFFKIFFSLLPLFCKK